MKGLLGIVILVLDVIAIIDAAKSSLDTGKKILWIAVIIILPIAGLVLYYLVGKKK